MNVCRHTLVAGAIALALACGGAYAQSTSGGSAGNSGAAQGQSGRGQNDAQGATGANGMNGAQGANGMRGTTQGCSNQATTASRNVSEPNRSAGSPVQGAASKGSTDWSDQANCGSQGGRSAAPRPRNGGG